VPHRPEGFDVPLEVVVALLDRALGEESAKLMHRHTGKQFPGNLPGNLPGKLLNLPCIPPPNGFQLPASNFP
jgi:hypothetical protein